MEMQPTQPQPLGRQPTLESQQSSHNHAPPSTQASRLSLFRLIPVGLRRDNNRFPEHRDVFTALKAASLQHKGGSRFRREYNQTSHQNRLSLHTTFDLYVRESFAASESEFQELWFCQNVSAKSIVQSMGGQTFRRRRKR